MPTLKRCCSCKLQRPLSTFSRNRSRKDGLHSQCRPCHTASVTKARRRKAEALRAALIEAAATLSRIAASIA